MKLGQGTIASLGDIAFDTGMNSSSLIGFFNSFGLNENVVHMLGSKRQFAVEAWRKLSGSLEVADAINAVLSPHYFPNANERTIRVQQLQRCLRQDGFELTDDGYRVYIVARSGAAATGVLDQLKVHGERLNHHNVLSRIRIIEREAESSPTDSIGSAKELIEAVCKDIIERSGASYDRKSSPAALVKEALKCLKLAPDDIPERSRGVDAVRATLNSLANIAHQMDELRGLYGSGHGKPSSARGLLPRHARLAVGSSATLCLFLIEAFEERERNGEVS
jgi:hypothetical protein